MQGLSGLITTPMWREFMDVALEKLPEESFSQPWYPTEGVKPVIRGQYINTDALIASMQNQNNSTSTDEEGEAGDPIQLSDIYNNIHTILHYVDKNDPMGPAPTAPGNDPQYNNWEYGVQRWKEATFGAYAPGAASTSTVEITEEDEEETPTERRRRRN